MKPNKMLIKSSEFIKKLSILFVVIEESINVEKDEEKKKEKIALLQFVTNLSKALRHKSLAIQYDLKDAVNK